MVAVAAVLVVCSWVATQASEIMHNEAYEADDFLQASASPRLEAILASMTTESALRAMPAVPHTLKALIVENVGANASQLLRMHTAQTAQGIGFLQAAAVHRQTPAASSGSGADGARTILNDMIKEAADKLDFERVRCSSLLIKLTSIREETIQDISEYNAQAADARARVLKAQTIISEISITMPRLQETLAIHKRKCLSNIAALVYKLKVIRNDITVLDKVVSMTQCASSTTAAGFIQCKKKHAQPGHGATSFITFSRKSLRAKVAELTSNTAKAALQGALRDIYATARPLRGLGLASVARRENLALAQVGEAHVLIAPVAQVNASGAPIDKEQQRSKCSVANSPNCNKLRDKFLLMQTTISDQEEQMSDELAATRKDCAEAQLNYETQIADLESRLKDAQTMLAEATKDLQTAQENSRMKEQQKTQVELEMRKSMSECRKNIEGYETEICGIRKIRLELYKMSDLKKFIRDCEVAAWTPGDCTASCGGGTQQLTRLIMVPAEMGAGCPPLSMSRDCNEQECPVDCRLSSWSGWSSCSALCNGGVMSRAKVTRTQPQHGGLPCGATTDTEPCNIQSCDKDCDLSGWTKWGHCSKACDGGFQMRQRHVATKAMGEGSCPKRWSKHRLRYKSCNAFKCTPVKEILECTAKLDVVLLLDGSGSIGSNGWAQTKKAATTIINAFQTGDGQAQVAVLSFSGPSTYRNYLDCTGNGTDSQGQPVNYADQCKIAWVSHFSTEKVTIVSAVDALAWPRASTLTSAALATAEAELAAGRKDAEAIVIVITDGRPMNPRKTYQASQRLKKKARLMFVPVTRYAPLKDIEKWASRPVRDNVLKVDKFSDLSGTGTINELIADACPEVK